MLSSIFTLLLAIAATAHPTVFSDDESPPIVDLDYFFTIQAFTVSNASEALPIGFDSTKPQAPLLIGPKNRFILTDGKLLDTASFIPIGLDLVRPRSTQVILDGEGGGIHVQAVDCGEGQLCIQGNEIPQRRFGLLGKLVKDSPVQFYDSENRHLLLKLQIVKIEEAADIFTNEQCVITSLQPKLDTSPVLDLDYSFTLQASQVSNPSKSRPIGFNVTKPHAPLLIGPESEFTLSQGRLLEATSGIPIGFDLDSHTSIAALDNEDGGISVRAIACGTDQLCIESEDPEEPFSRFGALDDYKPVYLQKQQLKGFLLVLQVVRKEKAEKITIHKQKQQGFIIDQGPR